MKRYLIIPAILLIPASVFSQPVGITAKDVLNNTIQKLSVIKHIEYNYKRETDYSSDNYKNTMTAQCYFDFTNNNPITNFRFWSKGENYSEFFNGTEHFQLNNKEKTIQINAKPQLNQFQHQSYFYNSLLTLKNSLPLVAADRDIRLSVTDTLLKSIHYYKLTFSMMARQLAYIKGFVDLKPGLVKYYDLVVDKSTYLPVQVIERNNINHDFVRTTFTAINLTPAVMKEQAWFYSTYMPEYAEKSTVQPELIKTGTIASGWKLPLYGKRLKDSVDLNNYKGKLTLVDVFIKNCGPCILSVPELNKLRKDYAANLNIISVNVYDDLSNVDFFIKKYKPEYTVAYNGQSLVKEYGISAYPTTILLDRDGRVLYASPGFDKPRLEQLIKAHL